MQDDTIFAHLENSIDGYTRAKDAGERRLFLRATVRGLYMLSLGMTKTLRALVAAL